MQFAYQARVCEVNADVENRHDNYPQSYQSCPLTAPHAIAHYWNTSRKLASVHPVKHTHTHTPHAHSIFHLFVIEGLQLTDIDLAHVN